MKNNVEKMKKRVIIKVGGEARYACVSSSYFRGTSPHRPCRKYGEVSERAVPLDNGQASPNLAKKKDD